MRAMTCSWLIDMCGVTHSIRLCLDGFNEVLTVIFHYFNTAAAHETVGMCACVCVCVCVCKYMYVCVLLMRSYAKTTPVLYAYKNIFIFMYMYVCV